MGLEWLNRIGIIMNFIAGFMLAPELIGLKRLKRIEDSIEKSVSLFDTKIDNFLQKSSRYIKMDRNTLPYFVIISGLTVILLYLFTEFLFLKFQIKITHLIIGVVAYLMFAFVLRVIVFLARGEHLVWRKLATVTNKPLFDGLFLIFVILTHIFVFIIFYYLLILVILFPITFTLKGIRAGVGYILRKLEGKETLRNIVVWWGVIFFIFGNLFQLVATF